MFLLLTYTPQFLATPLGGKFDGAYKLQNCLAAEKNVAAGYISEHRKFFDRI